jgi:heme exporter protein D
MTTQYNHNSYLDRQDDPMQFWEQRIKASRWMIVKTFALGALAAGLAVLAQGWLEQAAPLFPFISQNYGIWQAGYLLSLVVIFLLWAAAMLQKLGLLQNSKQGRAKQLRIDDQNERRLERVAAARARREQELAARETVVKQAYFKVSARSKKFDY